jgi:hypothetical protein
MPAWILEASRTRVGPAIGRGLPVFFGLPILAVSRWSRWWESGWLLRCW